MSSRMRNGHLAHCVVLGYFSSPFHTWCDVSSVRHSSQWQVSGAGLQVHHKVVYPVRQHTHRANAAKKAALTALFQSPLSSQPSCLLISQHAYISLVQRNGQYKVTLKTRRITKLWDKFTKLGPLWYCSFFSPHCPTHRALIQDESPVPLILLSKISLNQSHGWGTGEATGKINKRMQPMALFSLAPISFHMERLELSLFGILSLRECGTKTICPRVSAISLS